MGHPNIIHAPFSSAQIAQLNAYQSDGRFYPMTCGACMNVLVPLKDGGGLMCRVCGNLQRWAPYAVFVLGGES